MSFELISQALNQYGATLNSEKFIQRNGKTLQVKVDIKKNRVRFEMEGSNRFEMVNSTLLYSGPVNISTVEKFVENFWYWKKESI